MNTNVTTAESSTSHHITDDDDANSRSASALSDAGPLSLSLGGLGFTRMGLLSISANE